MLSRFIQKQSNKIFIDVDSLLANDLLISEVEEQCNYDEDDYNAEDNTKYYSKCPILVICKKINVESQSNW